MSGKKKKKEKKQYVDLQKESIKILLLRDEGRRRYIFMTNARHLFAHSFEESPVLAAGEG